MVLRDHRLYDALESGHLFSIDTAAIEAQVSIKLRWSNDIKSIVYLVCVCVCVCVFVCVCVCVFVYACVRVPRSVKQLYCDSKYACIHICSILYRLHSLLTLKGDIHVILHLRTCTYTL